jgi:hypothetical protein
MNVINLTGKNKMAKKQINKISDKLAKVNDNFSINMYDNGFLIEVSGRDEDDEYRNAKIMVPTVEQLLELVKEAATLPRDE